MTIRICPLALAPVLLAVLSAGHADPPATTSQPRAGDWRVYGTVSDPDGQPISGAEIVAHCGRGTLRVTGRALSGADGRYDLRFGPGILVQTGSPALQAATISVHKTGLVERNLYRQGDLRMARRPPNPDELAAWGIENADRTVYPDRPRRVDFVMVPAAAVRGRLRDATGNPIADHWIWISGPKLPPSSSALRTMRTEPDGSFAFDGLPSGELWLGIRLPEDKYAEVQTEHFQVPAGATRSVELTLVTTPTPALQAAVNKTEPAPDKH